MLATYTDDVKIVQASLRGSRPVDRKTMASVDVLVEKLERLKMSSRLFAGVDFSDHVKRLAARGAVPAAG